MDLVPVQVISHHSWYKQLKNVLMEVTKVLSEVQNWQNLKHKDKINLL